MPRDGPENLAEVVSSADHRVTLADPWRSRSPPHSTEADTVNTAVLIVAIGARRPAAAWAVTWRTWPSRQRVSRWRRSSRQRSSTIISMVAAGLGVATPPVNVRQVSPRVKVHGRLLVRPTVNEARRLLPCRR